MYGDKAWAWVLTAVIGYLLGSFSGSITVSRFFYKDDIRHFGSGNAGMTNVLRTYGKGKAALTLAIDFAKTIIAISVGRWLIGGYAVGIAGAAVTIGHAYPIYYGFKGGKAAACSAACIMMMDLRVFAVAAAIFFGVFFACKIVSVASLSVAATLPLSVWFFFRDSLSSPVTKSYLIFSVYIFVFVTYLHRGNIKRLLNGAENTFSKKGKGDRK